MPISDIIIIWVSFDGIEIISRLNSVHVMKTYPVISIIRGWIALKQHENSCSFLLPGHVLDLLLTLTGANVCPMQKIK